MTGCLNDDLKQAALDALELDPSQCLAQASEYTWEIATKMFQSNLASVSAS